MQSNNTRLCLNMKEVRERMEKYVDPKTRKTGLTRKALSKKIGMKDYHTLTYYFEHPDRIRLNHVTTIAAVLGSSPYQYDEFIVRISSEEEFRKLVSGEEF